jgi:hypothetical protein
MSEVTLGSPLPDELLDHEVFDASGRGQALREWSGGSWMLVYLRHFG